MENAGRGNGAATGALVFALIAAALSALTYFTLPAMVQKGVENVEAMKVGGPEKYAQLKKIYQENASVFGEQVDQIQAQIEMYKQMQTNTDTGVTDATDMSADGTTDTMTPSQDMVMTGDEAAQ